jgi:hypothetical protein
MSKCKHYKPYMDILKKIVGGFYSLKDCGAGGPLHVLLDDDNFDIKTVHFCMEKCLNALAYPEGDPYGYDKEVYLLGIVICNEYAKMSLEERAVFDSYICGQSMECYDDCNCDECLLKSEIYEWMKEAEEVNHD